MSAFLRALSRRIRLAIHRHDPIECWCELTTADAPCTCWLCRPVQTGCVYCTSWNREPHDPWCPRVGQR